MYDTVYTRLSAEELKGGTQSMEACCTMNNYGSESRRFLTREEKVEMLREYKQELELEAKGVGEQITELEKQE